MPLDPYDALGVKLLAQRVEGDFELFDRSDFDHLAELGGCQSRRVVRGAGLATKLVNVADRLADAPDDERHTQRRRSRSGAYYHSVVAVCLLRSDGCPLNPTASSA